MIRSLRPIPRRSLLMCGTALVAASLMATSAQAQTVEIAGEQAGPVSTATAGANGGAADVTITGDGVVALGGPGAVVTVNSDNQLINAGTISATDVNNATGVALEGGANRSFLHSGTIRVDETFEQADTDGDPFNDTPIAAGSGRTGILVSGASPFQGNITAANTSTILVEGNQSYGVDLSNTPLGAGLDGSLTMQGQTTVLGNNSAGVRVGSAVTGNVVHDGVMDINGVNSSAFDIGADIGGGFTNTGTITNNAFRFSTRAPFDPNASTDRSDLGAEDLRLAGSSIIVNANIARGINLTTRAGATSSNIQHASSTPAILIDGEGQVLSIGTISPITDPNDANFNFSQSFAFVNEGTVQATGLYDDFDATTLSITDATLDGGLRNAGLLSSETFVAGVRSSVPGVATGTGLSRVVVLGDDATVNRIINTGQIVALAQEAADEIYSDRANIPAPRSIAATAIDVDSGAVFNTLDNSGSIVATVNGRLGSATAIRDASGTLNTVTNRGTIAAVGASSDSEDGQATSFQTVALDLSANTSGVTLLQERASASSQLPTIDGDIRLGSGNDSVTSSAGSITGDIAFGGGNDVLSLAGTTYDGTITNTDGLVITVAGSSLGLQDAGTVGITSASFDSGSTFRPVVDGVAGASTLQASGTISFADGAQVLPRFSNIIQAGQINGGPAAFPLASAATLNFADVDALNAADDGSYLVNTAYAVQGNDLVVTIDLRDAQALGLDSTQTGIGASAFNATLQALQANPELGNEVANIGAASEFFAAYNQLLPEIGAAARQFVVANTDGAVGAVGNHLDAARRSPDKPGGAWLQQFAYFADRELSGLSEQYRGEGFGFAAGLDTEIGPFHAVGVNIGFASTEIEDVVGVDNPLDVTTLLAGLYAGYATGGLGIDLYGGIGLNQFEQERVVQIGDFRGQSQGDWNGLHVNGGVRVGYDVSFGKRFWARPVVSLDYMRLTEDAFTETGDVGVALSVLERTSEIGAATALFNVGAEFNGARTWIRPSIRVGYRNEFLSDPVLTEYMFSGITNAAMAQTTSGEFPDSGLLLGFSIAAGSGFSSVGFDFDSDIRDGFIRHTGRIVVRLLF